MKQKIAPRPKNCFSTQNSKFPEIKKISQDSITTPVKLLKSPPNQLTQSRISRQSSSIDASTISQDSQRKQQQSQQKKNNVDQLVKNKTYFNHRSQMNDYLKRQNISIATKVFCFNSQDDYIKRCLKKHGWIETPCTSQYFDLKWVYTENQDDYKVLLDGQFYNHFKNTKELTTKSCLISNFKNQSIYGLDTTQFFPRAYDLGNSSDREDFIKDYEKTSIFIILKKSIIQLKQQRKDQMKQLKLKILEKINQKKQEILINRINLKKIIKKKYKQIYTSQELETNIISQDIKFNISIMSELLQKLSDYKRQQEVGFYDDKNFELTIQQINKIRLNFIQYSQLENYNKGQNPSEFLVEKLYKYHLFFKQNDQSYKIDGINNLWIIKPGGCARGQGIYLENNIMDAINSGLQMQARIVQKYIEKPLLYNNYKFDLRQWVLVRSFKPLQAFVFSHCYMRMCSQQYDIKDTKNLLKHLTNFSLNKNEFKNQNDSIYSSDFLQTWLPIDWNTIVKPQCNQLIIKTLQILQDQFEDESKYCFELFGFDIILDQYCKPWLLEVNLSPACAERADWLHEMLDGMAESMFQIIFGNQFKSNEKYYYELLIDENDFNNDQQINDIQIEIWGQKCNIKKEKIIDKKYIENLATLMIQKFYRMYQAKKIKRFLKNTKYAIIIQKYIRRFLAKQLKNQLIQYNAARKIQTIIRKYLAIKYVYNYKRYIMATKIQCFIKQKQSLNIKYELQQELALLYLQGLIRIRKSKNLAMNLKKKLNKYIIIQKWWKQQFYQRCFQVNKINSYIKMFIQQKKYSKLLKQHKASIIISKYIKMYQAIKLKKRLQREYATLLLQNIFLIKLSKNQLQLLKIEKGLIKFSKIYYKYKSKISLVNIYNIGILREKAIRRIQGYRLVLKCKKYLKRLKRLKKFIKLQANIKGFLQRKRYLRLIKKKKAILKIIKSIRRYIFKLKIQKKIYRKRKSMQLKQQSNMSTIQSNNLKSNFVQQQTSNNFKRKQLIIQKKK